MGIERFMLPLASNTITAETGASSVESVAICCKTPLSKSRKSVFRGPERSDRSRRPLSR
jgi:hypothetical protein